MKFGIRKPNYKARFKARQAEKENEKSGQSFLRQKGRWIYQKPLKIGPKRDISQNHRGRTLCSPEIEVPQDFACK